MRGFYITDGGEKQLSGVIQIKLSATNLPHYLQTMGIAANVDYWIICSYRL